MRLESIHKEIIGLRIERCAMASECQNKASTMIFFDDFSVFCIDSLRNCLSPNADKVCVPIALTAVFALCLLLSCAMLVYQTCNVSGERLAEVAACSLYCFFGNLCSIVGAILSRQLVILVFMGVFASVMDVVKFISALLKFYLRRNSNSERRRRMMRLRRRQNLIAVCVLMVLGGGYLSSKTNPSSTDRPYARRRLLHTLMQDNTEILGYVLGLLSFLIACTSKFPTISRAFRREAMPRGYVFSATLCTLAGVLYASAILFYDTKLEFVVKAMPWLLSAMCCVTLDLLSLVLYMCSSGKIPHSQRCSPDTESLLGGSDIHAKGTPPVTRHRKQKNAKKITEMGDYMDVSVQPTEKVCLKEVMASGEGAPESQPLVTRTETVQVIRSDGLCSSDSSSVSSDLEWDFGEASTQWRKLPVKQENRDEFPLQEWPRNPAPFGTSTCGTEYCKASKSASVMSMR